MIRRSLVAALILLGLVAVVEPPGASAQGRRRPAPDPPSRAHRIFRARIREARTAAALEKILSEIEKELPDSRRPAAATVPPEVDRRYESDPETTYRAIKEPAIRAALDRRLWADAMARSLEFQVDASPQDARELAQRARERLPERPGLADSLVTRGLEIAAARDIGSLRQSDIEALAREQEKDPGRAAGARDLKRRWLDDQREHRLSPTDAEGRIVLANQYRALLGDSATAGTLLQDALRIDPQSLSAASALEGMGYRKVGDRWESPEALAARPSDPAPEPVVRPGEPAGSLRGQTRDEVRGKLGKPDRVARVATQGRILEQWIYKSDNRGGGQFVNFSRLGPRVEPTVDTHGPLP